MKKQKTIEEKVKILLPLPTYVEEVLNENEILFEKDDDEPNYRIGIHGECVDIDIVIQCCEDKDIICLYALAEFRIPKDKLMLLLPKINQLNLDNPGSCLRLDMDERLLSSTFMINTDGGISDHRILQGGISQCFNMLDHNISSLLEIAFGKENEQLMLSSMEAIENADGAISC